MHQGPASAVAVGLLHACAIVDGNVVCWGNNETGELGDPTLFETRQCWVQLVHPS